MSDILAALADRELVPAFWRFASGLLGWIRWQTDPGLGNALREAQRAFLCDVISSDLEAELIRSDPVLALRLVLQMAEAALPPAHSETVA